jgi:mRNA-degrading endonuclease YafQ of YafQ-DinJ toxin-antitoxin module
MLQKLYSTKRFEKAYKKFVKNHPFLQNSIDKTLLILEEDPFSTLITTHNLSGKLYGLLSCTCAYDCRIIFRIEKHKDIDEEHIILLDIGTHEEVY